MLSPESSDPQANLLATAPVHQLCRIADLDSDIDFSSLIDRQESCNRLCRWLTNPATVQKLMRDGSGWTRTEYRKAIIDRLICVWNEDSLQLEDWLLRGCPFSSQLKNFCGGKMPVKVLIQSSTKPGRKPWLFELHLYVKNDTKADSLYPEESFDLKVANVHILAAAGTCAAFLWNFTHIASRQSSCQCSARANIMPKSNISS